MLHVTFLPLPVVRTVDLVTVSSSTISNQVVAGNHSEAHGVNTCTVILECSTLWGLHITLAWELLWPALVVHAHTSGCVSCLFGKICNIWLMTRWYCAYLTSTSWISLSLQDMSGQGAGGNGDTNWLPYVLEMLEWLVCLSYIALLCLQ